MTAQTDVGFRPGPVDTDDVLFARQGALGRILLNRPKAINALTRPMVTSMLAQLEEWAAEDTISVVSVEGAGGRGLCAGGDVRAIRSSIVEGVGDPVGFWADEYRLDAAIHRFPKPFVALMDGIVMGGGVGISAYGSLRLATERSRVAMPETAIGFFPDVGALFLLARAPGELGTHLAMTGQTVSGADAVLCGLADAVVASSVLPSVVERLTAGGTPDVASFGDAVVTGPPALDADREWVDECYAGDDPAAILEALRSHPSPRAREAADLMAGRSPLSVAVTLEAIRRAGRMATLEEVLAQDLALGRAFLVRSDFVEGVRAVLVDRDHAPRWSHRSLADVDPEQVRRMFPGEGSAGQPLP